MAKAKVLGTIAKQRPKDRRNFFTKSHPLKVGGIIKKLISLIATLVILGSVNVLASVKVPTVSGVDFGEYFPLGREACLQKVITFPSSDFGRCAQCVAMGYVESDLVDATYWGRDRGIRITYSKRPCTSYTTSNGFMFDYQLLNWNSSSATKQDSGTYFDYEGLYGDRVFHTGKISIYSLCEHHQHLGYAYFGSGEAYRVSRVSKPYPFTTVVPEFTPTAIKLKNCRFSPHDGITSQRKEVM